ATRKELVASYHEPFPQKINLISCEPLAHISYIKLIRTDTTLDLSQKAEKDTTLDLSQKAEKGMLCTVFSFPFYTVSLGLPPLPQCGIIEHIQSSIAGLRMQYFALDLITSPYQRPLTES
ncbi:hypothetical protein RJ639_022230, partial [Escallonia herrerae]